jgi:hypothetical protein
MQLKSNKQKYIYVWLRHPRKELAALALKTSTHKAFGWLLQPSRNKPWLYHHRHTLSACLVGMRGRALVPVEN